MISDETVFFFNPKVCFWELILKEKNKYINGQTILINLLLKCLPTTNFLIVYQTCSLLLTFELYTKIIISLSHLTCTSLTTQCGVWSGDFSHGHTINLCASNELDVGEYINKINEIGWIRWEKRKKTNGFNILPMYSYFVICDIRERDHRGEKKNSSFGIICLIY